MGLVQQLLRLVEIVLEEGCLGVPFRCTTRRVCFLAGLCVLDVRLLGHDVVSDLFVQLSCAFEMQRGSQMIGTPLEQSCLQRLGALLELSIRFLLLLPEVSFHLYKLNSNIHHK